MRIERKLKKVGGSVMLPIPAEILGELHWGPEQTVMIDSDGGVLKVESGTRRPSPEVMEFAREFFEEYDAAMRELADR